MFISSILAAIETSSILKKVFSCYYKSPTLVYYPEECEYQLIDDVCVESWPTSCSTLGSSEDVASYEYSPLHRQRKFSWIIHIIRQDSTDSKETITKDQSIMLQDFVAKAAWCISKRKFKKNEDRIQAMNLFLEYCRVLVQKLYCDPQRCLIGLYFYHLFTNKTRKYPHKGRDVLCYLAISFIEAQKLYEDMFWTNREYIKVLVNHPFSDVKQLNQVEREFLKIMNYEMFVGYDDLKEFVIDMVEKVEKEHFEESV